MDNEELSVRRSLFREEARNAVNTGEQCLREIVRFPMFCPFSSSPGWRL